MIQIHSGETSQPRDIVASFVATSLKLVQEIIRHRLGASLTFLRPVQLFGVGSGLVYTR